MQEYLKILIWTMFFVVLIEMIFPSSDLRKYLKLVLGFIVIYILISPLINLLTSQNQSTLYEGYLMYYQQEIGGGVEYSAYEEEKERQERSLKRAYEKQVGNQVKALLEERFPVQVKQVQVYFLDALELEVEKVEISVKSSEDEKADLFKVEIGNKNENYELEESYLIKEIKKYLNDFYNWDKANIYITVQH